MYLSPADEDRLRVFAAADLARRTLARGLRLNAPEAVAVPPVEVDRSDGTVRLHERVLRAGPVRQVPLSRRYLLG